MLLRKLQMKRRDRQLHYWDYCEVYLMDKSCLHVERTTELHPMWPAGQYNIYRRDDVLNTYTDGHEHMQELEAQAVLDHYVTTYGLLPEVTDA